MHIRDRAECGEPVYESGDVQIYEDRTERYATDADGVPDFDKYIGYGRLMTMFIGKYEAKQVVIHVDDGTEPAAVDMKMLAKVMVESAADDARARLAKRKPRKLTKDEQIIVAADAHANQPESPDSSEAER